MILTSANKFYKNLAVCHPGAAQTTVVVKTRHFKRKIRIKTGHRQEAENYKLQSNESQVAKQMH